MSLRCLLTLAVLCSTGFIARADTISTFNFTGGSVFYGMAGDQNTVSGTTTIDVTTGFVQSISFTAGGSYQFGVALQQGSIVYVGASGAKISFDAGSLINYAGSTFDLNGPNDLYVGHITPAGVAVTPEPSSLVLFFTGLLGVVGVTRRRSMAGRARWVIQATPAF